MALDINRAFMYADPEGTLHREPTRRRFCVVDGIIAGEGMGPIYADPKACGVILAGSNPVAVDIVGAELMGFDHQRIPMLAGALRPHRLPLATFDHGSLEVASNVGEWNGGGLQTLRAAAPFTFSAPLGWQGHMERSRGPAPIDL
jgi:hypothetical protein